MESLKFTRGECVEEGFYASQASDGTIYFVKAANLFDGAIYATCNGAKIYANSASWDGQIKSFACHGNEVFFRTKNYETEEEKGIYKARLYEQCEIRVEFVRDMLKNEEGQDGMMLIRKGEDGKQFARNAWDAEEIEVGEDILWALMFGVHRGKLLYTRNTNDKTRVHKIYPNTILIEKPGYGCGEYCDDSSSLVFLCTEWKEMTVVNVGTKEWRNIEMGIADERDSIYSIVGVYDGKMTVLGEWNGKSWIYTADLPESIREFEQLTPL